MFMTFYHFYRLVALDGIVNFALLSCTIYMLCGARRRWLRGWLYVLLSTVVYFAMMNLPSLPVYALPSTTPYVQPYWYYFLCNILVGLVLAHFLLDKAFLFKLIYIVFYVSFVQLYKMVCEPLYEREFLIPERLYAALDICSELILCVLLVLLILLFRKFPLDTSLRFAPSQLFIALYFPVSLLMAYVLVTNSPTLLNYSLQIISAVVITNLPVIYYFLSLIIRSYEDLRSLDQALTQTQAQLTRFRFSLTLQEQLKKERHELKNNYYYIQALLKQEKYDQLNAYLEKVTGEDLAALNQIETGNALMDYLLNRKLGEARQHHIRTCTEVVVPTSLTVSEDAFCTILLNLLDNAIEASRKEEDPLLQITIKCVQEYLVCVVRNKVSRDVLAENPDLRTTKADKNAHGFGTKIVSQAVERCDGILNYSMEDGFFTVKVMLPLTHHRDG